MKRFALTAALALGLTLTACNNEPEEEAQGSSGDSVAPNAAEAAGDDEVVSEGPSDDATPYAGTTGGAGDRGASGSADAVPGTGGEDGAISGSGGRGSNTMSKGRASPAGARPPKGSKLQQADPR